MEKPAPPHWGSYVKLRPDLLQAIQREHPVAYLPFGCIMPHGRHLPYGTDGLIAEELARRTAERIGGVLFPTTWWSGLNGAGNHHKLDIQQRTFTTALNELLDNLHHHAWQIAVLVTATAHAAHELTMMQIAEQRLQHEHLLVMSISPLTLIDINMLDHAALWESSLVLSIAPSLVDIYSLNSHAPHEDFAGRDPRGVASASLGDTVIDLAVERMVRAITDLRTTGDPNPLRALYAARRARIAQQQQE